jgi:phage terminase large subunit-like protein
VMNQWTTARPDWEARIKSGRSLLPDLPLDRKEANAALEMFLALRLPDVVGQPELQTVAGEWQKDLVRAVFGSYDPVKNERHIREFFCMIPKKSGKTTGAAAMMICAVLLNRRPRAEFLLIAPTLEVADLAFRQVVGMIESDPVLTGKFHIRDHVKTIIYRDTKAFLKVKSFDPRVVVGSKPCGVLVDELHAISGAHDADRVMGQLRGGLIANPEAFLISITTQSERQPSGVFKEALHNARRVRDGEMSLPLLPLIYEFPRNVEWKDSANWRMVNPTPTVSIDRLIPDYEAAASAGEHELRRWASQHLNIEIGIGLQTDRWPGAEFWERQTDPSLTLEQVLDRSEVIVCGMDGGLDDLFGFAVLGRDKDGRDMASKSWLLWSHAWCHKSVLDRRKSIVQRLRDFERAGELTICDDELDDLEAMKTIIADIRDRGLLAHVAVDPAGVGDIVDAMASIGVTEQNKMLWPVGQGFRLMNALKSTERRLIKRTLWHSRSSMMNWCVGNLKIEPTATAIRATKMHAGDAKIDPAMAMFNACDVLSTNPDPANGPPNYDVIFA